MYAFVDQPVECLSRSGRFLLWAMRGWATAIERGTCPPVALSRGFAGVNALPALPDFHIAMALLNKDASTPLSLAPMIAEQIMEDEAILIGLWSDLSRGDIDHLRDTLVFVAEADAVSPIARAMTTVMAKLIAAGFEMSELRAQPLKESK